MRKKRFTCESSINKKTENALSNVSKFRSLKINRETCEQKGNIFLIAEKIASN